MKIKKKYLFRDGIREKPEFIQGVNLIEFLLGFCRSPIHYNEKNYRILLFVVGNTKEKRLFFMNYILHCQENKVFLMGNAGFYQ